jgi:hypothetical protein
MLALAKSLLSDMKTYPQTNPPLHPIGRKSLQALRHNGRKENRPRREGNLISLLQILHKPRAPGLVFRHGRANPQGDEAQREQDRDGPHQDHDKAGLVQVRAGGLVGAGRGLPGLEIAVGKALFGDGYGGLEFILTRCRRAR